jgi:hypothetical protein
MMLSGLYLTNPKIKEAQVKSSSSDSSNEDDNKESKEPDYHDKKSDKGQLVLFNKIKSTYFFSFIVELKYDIWQKIDLTESKKGTLQ